MPKGSLLKLYLPNGVINVVRGLELSSRGTCQNPQFASTLLNTTAPCNWASVSSTFGKGCTSLRTLSFNFLKSTQIRTELSFFGTTTIPAHHGVGASIREITPNDSILSSSVRTFWHSGRGMFLGVDRAYGWVSGLSFMLYVSGKVPKPVNNDGYFVEISSPIDSTTASRLSALIAGKPRRFLFRSLIMNTGWLMVVSLYDKST